MAYITKANIEDFLNITILTPNGDNLVALLIPAVEAFAENYCGRKWGQTAQTDELHDGGADTYFPLYTPIASIQSVKVDDVALSAGEYFNYKSYIKLLNPSSSGNQNVKISYTPEVSVPGDLKLALIRWCAEIFKSQEDAGKTVSNYSIDGLSVNFLAQDGIPKYVELVLNKYALVAGF